MGSLALTSFIWTPWYLRHPFAWPSTCLYDLQIISMISDFEFVSNFSLASNSSLWTFWSLAPPFGPPDLQLDYIDLLTSNSSILNPLASSSFLWTSWSPWDPVFLYELPKIRLVYMDHLPPANLYNLPDLRLVFMDSTSSIWTPRSQALFYGLPDTSLSTSFPFVYILSFHRMLESFGYFGCVLIKHFRQHSATINLSEFHAYNVPNI